MKFAINYSTQAAALVRQGRITIDLFKCPDWPAMIAEAGQLRPVAVHFTLKAGDGRLHHTHWREVAHLMELTGTPYVNLHLDPRLEDYPGFAVEATDPSQRAQIIECMTSDVYHAARFFGPERLILENVPYRGPAGKAMRPGMEPVVITQIIEEAGCGLLLDISHARIAAAGMNMDERSYMSQLPVNRLRELHFTGLHTLENGALQDHLEVLESDWPILDWVLERIRSGEWARPWMLAFEYGGVGEKFAWRSKSKFIEAQAPLLFERLHEI
jgi:uncharacterized protein (UPF0276 family)